jgi:hypothetical protein
MKMSLRFSKFAVLLAAVCLSSLAAFGQASGVGNFGCPGTTTTGTVANSGTSNNTVLATVTATACPAVLVQLDQTSTLTAGAITFQISNDLGANYVSVPVAQVLNQSTFAQLTNPYTVVPSTNQAFLIILNGATDFQVKLTTAISGTGAVTPYVTPVGLPPGLALNSSGAAKVDGSGVTQPVSGTFWQATQPVSGTFWQATQPVSIASLPALPANQSVNVNQVAGAAPSATNPLPVEQSDGTNILGTSTHPVQVSLANTAANATAVKVDNSGVTQPVSGTVTANQGTANATPWNNNLAQIGGTAVVADPCQANAKSYVSINQTANAQLVTGTASKKIYPCSIHIVTATAQNIALVEGTGTTCGTSTTGVVGFGGSAAATGWNFAANGGLTYGDGRGALGQEGTAADNLCLFQSGTGQVSGGLSYVVQ